jgi:hypothetical protein
MTGIPLRLAPSLLREVAAAADIQTLNRLLFKMGVPVVLVEAAVLDIPT